MVFVFAGSGHFSGWVMWVGCELLDVFGCMIDVCGGA
jgi:hypothetical protein